MSSYTKDKQGNRLRLRAGSPTGTRNTPGSDYLVQQRHCRRLAEKEGMRLILLLPAREESHVIFICNLKLEIEG